MEPNRQGLVEKHALSRKLLQCLAAVAGGLAWGIQSSREAIDVEFVEDAAQGSGKERS